MVVKRQSTRNAREYLLTVRDTFQDNREIYDAFRKVMKDFKTRRICRSGVVSRVKDLFKGHPELILAFNKFLPKSYKISLESDPTLRKEPKFEEAVAFMNKVKATLQNDHTYQSFLKILQVYRQGKKSVTEIFHEVFDVLFRDHDDLRMEFVYFLPRYK